MTSGLMLILLISDQLDGANPQVANSTLQKVRGGGHRLRCAVMGETLQPCFH